MPNYGKTHSRFIRVYLDDADGTVRNISGSVTSIGNIGLTFDEDEVTTIADSVKQYLTGYGNSEITLSGPLNNTALAASPTESGAHNVFSGAKGITGNDASTYTLTIEIGIRAVPGSGDPKWSGEYSCSEYIVSADGVPTWSARLKASGSSLPAWGTK